MFTPVHMLRVRVLGLKQDQGKIISTLQSLGAVQLEQVDRASFFKEATPPEYARLVADQAFRFEGLLTALPPQPISGRMAVGDVNDVLEKARSIEIDDQVKKLKSELENVDLKINRNKTYIASLDKIQSFDKDLGILTTSVVSAGFYSVPSDEFENFRQAFTALSNDSIVELYSANKEDTTALVMFPREKQEQARTIFEKFKALRLEVPYDMGKPSEAKQKVEEGNQALEKERKNIENSLLDISRQYYGKVASIREALTVESSRFEALARGGQSDQTFVLEGWLPEHRLADLQKSLDGATRNRVVVETVPSKDLPPTLLQNSKSINYFEFFVRFFSLPKSEEIDPTITIAIIFPIFFGMMLGDVGYGLVILLIGYWLSGLYSGKTNAKYMPGPLRSFGKSLMPKRAMSSLGKILMPSAVVAIVVGVAINAYFGFKLPFYSPVIDLVRTPQIYLIITLFVGLGHLSLGYVYGIFIAKHEGRMDHLFSKIGWLGFLWSGVAVIAVALSVVLHNPLPEAIQYVGFAGLIIFGALIFRYEKGRFIMEIPTIISHVVSYGRILGVLLASLLLGVIAAQGIESSVGGPIGSFALSLVVLVLVTILNIVLGIFEPAIQGIRLHYVEFYSKFFEGNGKKFQPFAEKRSLTTSASSQ
jgi:V/A-type H+/Na+-transporting ATPase subunit I